MEQALQEWFQKVWGEGDLDAIDQMFVPDAMASGMMTGFEVGPEDFKALVPATRNLVRNLKVTIEKSVSADAWFWALVSVHAKNAETMEPVSIGGQIMMRLSPEGRVHEAYNNFDFISFFEQLGALPQDTMALCLAGEQLS